MVDEMRELLENSDEARPQHLFDTEGQQENLNDEEMYKL